jgi:dihydroorotase
MKPTLKTEADRAALWEALLDGTVDTIGSDHAPHTVEEKRKEPWPPGVPGIETSLPLLLNEISNGRLTLDRLTALCARNAALFFGMENKGALRPGGDADLTVIDMTLEKAVDERRLRTKCGWSPFKGRRLRGWPVMTIVGGRIVFDGEQVNNIYKGTEVRFAD